MKVSLEIVKGGMIYPSLIFAIGLLIVTACVRPSKRGLRPPNNLRCEYQAAPLGMDVQKPRLSWIVNDDRRGAAQTAYQILVASSETHLNQDQGDVWDSGKINSDRSVHVVYGGPALESMRRYYWKVRTWDRDDQPSPFSKTAWWEMGLLRSADWQAQWIGRTEERPFVDRWPWGAWIWHPKERGINHDVFFRHPFELPTDKSVTKAEIRATADNNFTLYLNEQQVGEGTTHTNIYNFDGKPFLRDAKNLIAIRAANTAGDICGLIFSLKITFTDNTTLVINTDGSWKTTAQSQSGWATAKFNDTKWQKVRVLEQYGGDMWGKIDETYIPPRSILVRNEFKIEKSVKQARAYVSGLGAYIMHLNGQRIGEDILTPGWTDYPTKIQYQTYDITTLIQKGENAVGAILGNAWWCGGLGWRGATVYEEGPLQFLMQMVIEYDDGSRETLTTDGTWKTSNSPILENSIYHGETYDARLEQNGWDKPGFDDNSWTGVEIFDTKTGAMVAQQGPPIRVTEEIKPVKVVKIAEEKYVFDLGQNMVGWARLKVSGSEGTKVTMRFAETLQPDGNIYTDNLRGARATDTYILKGEGTEVWEPHFTYHGFRFIEMSGYPGEPGLDAVTGRVFHSSAPKIGHFACSNELINKIYKNINWGQRGNMHSVPTDCPQRDERLGWMGDAQIFAPTASYNRNMAGFFTKWERDIIDCQDEDGAVHDVNPAIVVKGPAKPGWGDAVVVIPWVVYKFYGDKRILQDSYDGMAAWVNYMNNNSKGYLYERDGYGDWIAVDRSTPRKPIGAAYFFYDTKIMAKVAKILGKNEDVDKYEELAQNIAEAFNKKYLDKKTHQYEGATQAANLLPLAFGITPDDLESDVLDNILKDIHNRNDHLSTGFLGTAFLLPTLSDNGYHELAYKMASDRTYPSWGHMVEKGATTIWELWNSDTEGPSMNSRNHFALGSVGQWFYGYLAGLRPSAEEPGFKHTIIAPKPAGDLTWAEANIKSMYGLVASKWERQNHALTLNITIPANTSATIYIPMMGKEKPTITESGQAVMTEGRPTDTGSGIEFVELKKDAAVLSVGAGTYTFTIE